MRLIFERYLAVRSIRALVDELARRQITTKQRVDREGRIHGGLPFGVGPLAHLLRNPVYVGKVRHRDERFPGEHSPLIEQATWDEVQAVLSGKAPAMPPSRLSEPSLLVGRLFDGEGRPMTPSHGAKGSRRYRYYITRTDQNAGRTSWRVPAATIDTAVLSGLQQWLTSSEAITDALLEGTADPALIARANLLANSIDDMADSQRRSLLQEISARATLNAESIQIAVSHHGLLKQLGFPTEHEDRAVTVMIPARLTLRGCEARLAYPVNDHRAPSRIEPGLVKLIAEAEQAYAILTGPNPTPKGTQRDHHVRVSRLRFLAPDIISAILEGRQPVTMTRKHLLRAANIPLDWEEQRTVLGFARA